MFPGRCWLLPRACGLDSPGWPSWTLPRGIWIYPFLLNESWCCLPCHSSPSGSSTRPNPLLLLCCSCFYFNPDRSSPFACVIKALPHSLPFLNSPCVIVPSGWMNLPWPWSTEFLKWPILIVPSFLVTFAGPCRRWLWKLPWIDDA